MKLFLKYVVWTMMNPAAIGWLTSWQTASTFLQSGSQQGSLYGADDEVEGIIGSLGIAVLLSKQSQTSQSLVPLNRISSVWKAQV